MLYDFNEFNVSTIDAFFQSVFTFICLRSGPTGNYDLELDKQVGHTEQGIAETLCRSHQIPSDRPTPAGRWLEIYMTAKIDNGEAFNVL